MISTPARRIANLTLKLNGKVNATSSVVIDAFNRLSSRALQDKAVVIVTRQRASSGG